MNNLNISALIILIIGLISLLISFLTGIDHPYIGIAAILFLISSLISLYDNSKN
ncbi:hypothetical protein LJC03_01785 [Methanobrevibacter sp. OttesenSCG-928-I08]|nr:hypothetical protein [Methanobrevibacter sp. OttesenSCG-928-I08]